jgi:hypothetical protein
MPMSLPFFGQKKKSIDELEENTEQLEAENREKDQELTLEQKKLAIAKLKERGLTPGHFQWNWASIQAWIKTH